MAVIVDPDDLEAVRTAVRELMKAFPPNYWREVDESRRFPLEFFTAMGEHGYFGTLIDEKDGGSGAGPMVASVVIEEVNRSGGDAATLNAQMAICGVLIRHGSAEQKSVLR